MKGSLKVGDEVTIVGFPGRYAWMQDLLGERGRIVDVEEGETPVYRVEGVHPSGPVWFGGSFIEPPKPESEVA